MPQKSDVKPEKRPVKMTQAILDLGVEYKKDVIINGYGHPIAVTIRPLSEDELDLINMKYSDLDEVTNLSASLGKSLEELRKMSKLEYRKLFTEAVKAGKIPLKILNGGAERREEIIRVGCCDEPIKAHPEKLRFGAKSIIAAEIEEISTYAPEEIEDFLGRLADS